MYDRVSSAVCNCFHVDSDRDHGADHVHSGESFSCGVARSLYVRCCDFLLHSYQKFLIGFLAAFVLANPVFADEVSETQFSYESQLQQIQALNSIGELPEEAKKSTEHIESVFSGGMVKAPSVNPDVEFKVTGVKISTFDSAPYISFSIIFQGQIPDGYDRFRVSFNGSSYNATPQYDYVTVGTFNFGTSDLAVYLYLNEGNVLGPLVYSYPNLTISADTGTIILGNSVETSSYLASVQQVFIWILSHITELISFILGNAFLAVGLVLFMCGAVISFFVRVKNS